MDSRFFIRATFGPLGGGYLSNTGDSWTSRQYAASFPDLGELRENLAWIKDHKPHLYADVRGASAADGTDYPLAELMR